MFRACLLCLIFCNSCVTPPKVIEDSSPFALASGQSTMLLGSNCQRPLALGYTSCQINKAQGAPTLYLHFLNAAEFAVSDCRLGIFKTGSVKEASDVSIDLKPIQSQMDQAHFCLIRIEAVEKYPDPHDPKQLREIPFAGGFFIEILDDSYFPEPPPTYGSWCFKIMGTNKGRRKMERCS